jgi:hypothetical protein
MTGPELDLLEHRGLDGPAAFDPGARIDLATMCENARTHRGQTTMRPWATFIITGNADYVSNLAVRAQFLARGITRAGYRYQRYYQLEVSR